MVVKKKDKIFELARIGYWYRYRCLYMSVGNIAYIARKLIENGRKATTPVAVIEWGTTAQQRTITGPLDEIASIIEREGYHNPSMIVVGEVVNVREKFNGLKSKDLPFHNHFL